MGCISFYDLVIVSLEEKAFYQFYLIYKEKTVKCNVLESGGSKKKCHFITRFALTYK